MKRIVIFTLCWLVVAAAHAQNRTIDFTQKLNGLDDKPLLQAPDKPWTLSDVAVNALVSSFKDEDTVPSSKKFGYYELARKIYNKKAVSLSVEEIATIKERIGKMYTTAILGPALLALDPNTTQGSLEPKK